MYFAEYLRTSREKAGLTKAEFARKLGATSHHVYNWEAGVAVPVPTRIKDIAKVLGLDQKKTVDIFLKTKFHYLYE